MRERVRVYAPAFLIRRYLIKTKEKPWKYREIEQALVKARLPLTLQKFIAIATFYSWISFIIALIIGYLFFSVLIPPSLLVANLPSQLTRYFAGYYDVLISAIPLAGGLLFGVIAYKLVKYLILSYPFFIANRRKGEIDVYLPHAINMMYGMAIGGVGIYEIIKTIAESKSIFGELSKEFGIAIEMTEVFKRDVFSSLRYVRDTTPSEKLSGFLDNLVFILEGGGNLPEFLKGKSEEYLEEQEISFESYLESLGVMAEVYLSMFILLPLFLLVVLVVMQMLGGTSLELYEYGMIVFLPVATIFFAYLIKSMQPLVGVKEAEEIRDGAEKIKVYMVPGVRESFSIKKYRRLFTKLKKFILYPFIEKTIYTLEFRIISFHLALIGIIVLILGYKKLSPETLAIVTISAVAIPGIILVEMRERAIRRIEKQIPEIFRELALLNEAGLNVIEALKILSSAEFGTLSKELSIIKREIEWGTSIFRAFRRLEMRIRSDIIAKVVPIVIRALETSPTFKDTFQTVANYAASEVRLKNKMRSSMLTYIAIIYMSFFIFLYVSYTILQSFLGVFSGLNITTSGFGGVSFVLDVESVKETFYHISLLVGVLSGLIAGVISEGKYEAGLKHSYVLLLSSYITFRYLLA